MGMSNHIGAYAREAGVMQTALENGGATYHCATEGKARRFCQKAYYYRKLLHRHQAARMSNILETRPTVTPYDAMTLRREGKVVIISFDTAPGLLLDGEGNPLTLPDPTSFVQETFDDVEPLDDDTLEALDDARRNLGLEVE